MCLPQRVYLRRTHNSGDRGKIWISFDGKETWLRFARGYKTCPWVIAFKEAIEKKRMGEVRSVVVEREWWRS
jgi:hypothetical protein